MSSIQKVSKVMDDLHKLEVKYSKLNWTLYTTGYDFGVEEAYKERLKALRSEENYQQILESRELSGLSQLDKRRIEIAYNKFRPYHLSEELNELSMEIKKKTTELSKILNSFRYQLKGKKISSVELQQILTTDDSRENRKEAYLSRNQINKPMVEAGFIDLLELRKEYARLYGSEDFIKYRLEEDELDRNLFADWLKQLHKALPSMNDSRRKYAKKYLNDATIMPWDETYLAAKIAPGLNQQVDMSDYYNRIQEFFLKFGFNIRDYNITYDIFPRANKSEWGYNFTIETARDSRIIANVKNKYYEYGVLLHETGHALHSFLLDPDRIILNQGVSGIISEGIANLFQSFLYSPLFFEDFFDDHQKVEEEFTIFNEFKKINSLRMLNKIFFDHKLYENNPESLDDLNELYWRNNQEVLKEEPFDGEPPWAYIIHYTTHPIYYHNYFMGDVTCFMLEEVFEERYGAKVIEKPEEFGSFLKKEVVEPSGIYKYNELFKRISGEDFSLRYMF
ncbi:MAG: M3 family metallopeptidase [bacterium]